MNKWANPVCIYKVRVQEHIVLSPVCVALIVVLRHLKSNKFMNEKG